MLEVITGCMYSGKSEEMIRRLLRCKIAGQKVLAFKPRVDDRYSLSKIASHPTEGASQTFSAVPISSAHDLKKNLDSFFPVEAQVHVLAIDEVQFFEDSIVQVLEEQVALGRRVIVSGLSSDSEGKPFGPMPAILAKADSITHLTAICTRRKNGEICGNTATRTFRFSHANNGKTIQVGSKGIYEARCPACWLAG